MTICYRQHTGSLADSLLTTVLVSTLVDLKTELSKQIIHSAIMAR